MRSHRAIRFAMVLGGVLASIGAVGWPVLRRARQAAAARGSPETSARSGWQLPAITRNGAAIRPHSCSGPTAGPGIAGGS